MREIKFRVWDNDRRKMHSFDLSYPPEIPLLVALKAPVMQYTGLKDKNGVDIYEGDILKGGAFTWETHVVVWDAPKFISRMVSKYVSGELAGSVYYLNDTESDYCEVIGNIHENPELLETANEPM